jgi:uncharacterized protein
MANECLIVFIRYPEIGKVKTRLIPELGATGATLLYQQMAERTIEQARALQQMQPCAIEVWFVGGTIVLMQDWLGEDLVFQAQPDGDLGDRMRLAFQTVFNKGYQAATLIGTDCPALSAELLKQSFQNLQDHALTLGPAMDGGYYLIGLQQLIPELFAGIDWSTAAVLAQTLQIAEQLHIDPVLLPYLRDIDVPEDLENLQIL